jgi:penicillin amidase
MKLTTAEMLRGLGAGKPIAEVCAEAGITRDQFDTWWRAECARRAAYPTGDCKVSLKGEARIERDRWGIPHIFAECDTDLFFALGFATAQDRLFQLDYTRRKATGRLAEILGPSGVESDILYRTIGLAQIAEAEWTTLPDESRTLLQAYSDGINAWLASGAALPIEFDLLDYTPEPWRPVDSLAIEGEFRWYLTGRLPVLAIPEIIKRRLGNTAKYHAALSVEAGEEFIVWPGEYTPAMPTAVGPGGDGGLDGVGSNNWAVSPPRTTTGKPLIAGDPHLPYGAASIWYEARLQGGSFNVAGVMLSGLPAIMAGRNLQVAWTITNNICSLRDLYREKTSAEHSDHFLYDGKWERATTSTENIQVKGAKAVEHVVRSSRNGPLVDHLLPAPARDLGPVALRWVGQQTCGWFTALLNLDRAKTVTEFCEATRPWLCPSFNMICADTAGHIGLQTTGRIPLRTIWERGFRPGWDPQHQWSGLARFEDLPRLCNPERGFLVTANNRVAAEDYPIPLNCTATSGHRARRIRQEIERLEKLSLDDCQNLQNDVLSLRAAESAPPLAALLAGSADAQLRQAAKYLRDWDYSMELSSVAATIFNFFFPNWCKTVAVAGLTSPGDSDEALAKAHLSADRLAGLAVRLLSADPFDWFVHRDRQAAILETFSATLDQLTQRLGPDMATWQWSRVHLLLQPHYLSGRGDLGTLLDISGVPTRGDGTTVCSSTPNANGEAYTGAGHRLIADLADPRAGFWTVEAGSISGQPGSPHYRDQLELWNSGQLRYVALAEPLTADNITHSLRLCPQK